MNSWTLVHVHQGWKCVSLYLYHVGSSSNQPDTAKKAARKVKRPDKKWSAEDDVPTHFVYLCVVFWILSEAQSLNCCIKRSKPNICWILSLFLHGNLNFPYKTTLLQQKEGKNDHIHHMFRLWGSALCVVCRTLASADGARSGGSAFGTAQQHGGLDDWHAQPGAGTWDVTGPGRTELMIEELGLA